MAWVQLVVFLTGVIILEGPLMSATSKMLSQFVLRSPYVAKRTLLNVMCEMLRWFNCGDFNESRTKLDPRPLVKLLGTKLGKISLIQTLDSVFRVERTTIESP